MILKAAGPPAKRLIKRLNQRRARHEPRQAFAQHGVAGKLRELLVKLARQSYPRRKIAAFIRFAFSSDGRTDRLQSARAMSAANALDNGHFHDAPHLEHFMHLLHRRTRDKRTAVRLKIDQALARELRQRLPHRATFYIEYFEQLCFCNLGWGRKPMLEDRVTNVCCDRLGRRRSGGSRIPDNTYLRKTFQFRFGHDRVRLYVLHLMTDIKTVNNFSLNFGGCRWLVRGGFMPSLSRKGSHPAY